LYYNEIISGIIRKIKENGRIPFQVKFIRKSYRIRGKVARAQINIYAINIVLNDKNNKFNSKI